MTVDEYEAIKLADHLGLYQQEAALRMGVSRPTFGRILESARRKMAEFLVCGRALRIEGGAIAPAARCRAKCGSCHAEWEEEEGGGRRCPHCRCPAREQKCSCGKDAGRCTDGACCPKTVSQS